MHTRSASRCLIAAGCTAGLMGVVLSLGGRPAPAPPRGDANQPTLPRSWPLFGGTVHRNLANPFETNLPTIWHVEEKKQNLKWAVPLGSKAFGGPVIVGGKIFIGTNNQNPRDNKYIGKDGRPVDLGVLMCFRESDGQFLWQAVHPKLPAGRVVDWPLEGLPSMPAAEGSRLYYVSNRCELICADTEGFLDGKNDGVQDELDVGPAHADVVWRLDMYKELRVFPHNLAICSPLIVGDLVFVVTANGVDEGHVDVPSPAAPSFLAVDKRTGKVVWQNNSPTASLLAVKERGLERMQAIRRLRNRGELLMHGQWSNPTYSEAGGQPQVIFPGGDGWLRAFEPRTGKLLWKFDCNPKTAEHGLAGRGTRSDFIATPVVYRDRLYIGVGQDPEHETGVGHLWCVDLVRAVAKGRTNPGHDVSPVGDNFDSGAAANRDSALAWHYGGPIPDKQDRTKLRRKYYFGRTISTCAVHEGLVYAAELNGHLHCLDAETGAVYWTHDTRTSTWSSPLYADSKVYLPTDDGTVWVFAHGKQKRILAENEMPGRIRGVPVAVNGVLYITAENRLYALARDR